MNLKGTLAFFLVVIAASMVVLWMLHPPTGDASQIGLLAGFVTLFIKMAADAIGFQYNSSDGSQKKDEVNAAVAGKLADKVPSSAQPKPTTVASWWSLLSPAEQANIETMATINPPDARVRAILAALKSGKAEAPDLADLVTKGLLTQARADEINPDKT